MKTTSCLHRKFFSRPSVRDLVPDLKLILAVLTTACETHIGVYVPAGLSEDCGLDPAALAGGLSDLQRRGLIKTDPSTGEVFLTQWFRDNTFKTAARRGQAHDDFRLIESRALRDEVLRAVDNSTEFGDCGLKKADLLENQQVTSQGEGKGEGKGKHNHYVGDDCVGSGGDGKQIPKNKSPARNAGDQEAGQKSDDEVLQGVTVADCCQQHQLALAAAAAAASLDSRGAQKLADALAGALQAPEGTPGRLISRDNPAGWLQSTAMKIKNNEFVDNVAYLSAVAHRQAHAAETGTGGGSGVTIKPGVYVTAAGSVVTVTAGTAVDIAQPDGTALRMHVAQLVADVAAGRVTLTPVAPPGDAKAA